MLSVSDDLRIGESSEAPREERSESKIMIKIIFIIMANITTLYSILSTITLTNFHDLHHHHFDIYIIIVPIFGVGVAALALQQVAHICFRLHRNRNLIIIVTKM